MSMTVEGAVVVQLDEELPPIVIDEVADATTTTKGKAVILGGSADAPTVPWNKITDVPTGMPPTGGAGGVLSGSYPSPGFAVDMATQGELNGHTGDTANPHAVTKAQVGLGGVDNTSDVAKPVSTAQQAALDAVIAAVPEQARDAVGAALVAGTGITVSVDDAANTITLTATGGGGGIDTEAAQDAFAALIAAGTHSGISFSYNDAGNAVSATVAAQSWSQITGKPTFAAVATSGSATDITTGTLPDGVIPAAITRDSELAAHTGNTANPHAVTKAQVGLGSADNTSDTAKPVSTAQQTALDAKPPSTRTITTTSPLTGGGDLSADRTLAITTGTTSGTVALGDHTHSYAPTASPSFTGTATFGGPVVVTPDTVTYAATTTIDASLGSHFRITMTGALTLAAPTNPTDGQRILIELIQDGTGGRVLTLNAAFNVTTTVTGAITLTTTANTRSYIGAVYRSSGTKWDVLAFATGVAA